MMAKDAIRAKAAAARPRVVCRLPSGGGLESLAGRRWTEDRDFEMRDAVTAFIEENGFRLRPLQA